MTIHNKCIRCNKKMKFKEEYFLIERRIRIFGSKYICISFPRNKIIRYCKKCFSQLKINEKEKEIIGY